MSFEEAVSRSLTFGNIMGHLESTNSNHAGATLCAMSARNYNKDFIPFDDLALRRISRFFFDTSKYPEGFPEELALTIIANESFTPCSDYLLEGTKIVQIKPCLLFHIIEIIGDQVKRTVRGPIITSRLADLQEARSKVLGSVVLNSLVTIKLEVSSIKIHTQSTSLDFVVNLEASLDQIQEVLLETFRDYYDILNRIQRLFPCIKLLRVEYLKQVESFRAIPWLHIDNPTNNTVAACIGMIRICVYPIQTVKGVGKNRSKMYLTVETTAKMSSIRDQVLTQEAHLDRFEFLKKGAGLSDPYYKTGKYLSQPTCPFISMDSRLCEHAFSTRVVLVYFF
jgi:hypothetical protein